MAPRTMRDVAGQFPRGLGIADGIRVGAGRTDPLAEVLAEQKERAAARARQATVEAETRLERSRLEAEIQRAEADRAKAEAQLLEAQQQLAQLRSGAASVPGVGGPGNPLLELLRESQAERRALSERDGQAPADPVAPLNQALAVVKAVESLRPPPAPASGLPGELQLALRRLDAEIARSQTESERVHELQRFQYEEEREERRARHELESQKATAERDKNRQLGNVVEQLGAQAMFAFRDHFSPAPAPSPPSPLILGPDGQPLPSAISSAKGSVGAGPAVPVAPVASELVTCAQCGAQIEVLPGQDELTCPGCGHHGHVKWQKSAQAEPQVTLERPQELA